MDPALTVDRLPQPYRLIQKVITAVLQNVDEGIEEIEKKRGAHENELSLPAWSQLLTVTGRFNAVAGPLLPSDWPVPASFGSGLPSLGRMCDWAVGGTSEGELCLIDMAIAPSPPGRLSPDSVASAVLERRPAFAVESSASVSSSAPPRTANADSPSGGEGTAAGEAEKSAVGGVWMIRTSNPSWLHAKGLPEGGWAEGGWTPPCVAVFPASKVPYFTTSEGLLLPEVTSELPVVCEARLSAGENNQLLVCESSTHQYWLFSLPLPDTPLQDRTLGGRGASSSPLSSTHRDAEPADLKAGSIADLGPSRETKPAETKPVATVTTPFAIVPDPTSSPEAPLSVHSHDSPFLSSPLPVYGSGTEEPVAGQAGQQNVFCVTNVHLLHPNRPPISDSCRRGGLRDGATRASPYIIVGALGRPLVFAFAVPPQQEDAASPLMLAVRERWTLTSPLSCPPLAGGNHFAVGLESGAPLIFDSETLALAAVGRRHYSRVTAMTFGPPGNRLLITAGTDAHVHGYASASGVLLFRLSFTPPGNPPPVIHVSAVFTTLASPTPSSSVNTHTAPLRLSPTENGENVPVQNLSVDSGEPSVARPIVVGLDARGEMRVIDVARGTKVCKYARSASRSTTNAPASSSEADLPAVDPFAFPSTSHRLRRLTPVVGRHGVCLATNIEELISRGKRAAKKADDKREEDGTSPESGEAPAEKRTEVAEACGPLCVYPLYGPLPKETPSSRTTGTTFAAGKTVTERGPLQFAAGPKAVTSRLKAVPSGTRGAKTARAAPSPVQVALTEANIRQIEAEQAGGKAAAARKWEETLQEAEKNAKFRSEPSSSTQVSTVSPDQSPSVALAGTMAGARSQSSVSFRKGGPSITHAEDARHTRKSGDGRGCRDFMRGLLNERGYREVNAKRLVDAFMQVNQ
ncbi:unnamed protein product [Vitrella brassicaformis CCMP3155]|uniref:Uncharacterized protein n=2 Tax=Vitrella brassicaformis TaxID=1169539 RepID=A0A0G4GWY3_VITBC|nr:unnamed protein product [Vitrella brassicaformis CCMP3155]|eukprot:CEM35479.1 unnamed protein product [Vitrella brassicaformis CCMP3155]